MPAENVQAGDDEQVRHDPSCSIARTLEVIGDRWTILILRDCFRGVRRFDEFHRDLGIARNILTDRLQKLVDHGVLARRPYQQRPARYEYRLTPKGVSLSPALVALMRWGDTWLAGDSGVPLELTHKACGTPLDQVFICWTCDTTVGPTEIASRPGPGAPNRHSQAGDPEPLRHSQAGDPEPLRHSQESA